PLAVSPLSAWLALQWGLQAVRVVDAVPDRPAADAGSDLLGAQFRVTGVIGHALNDLAVPHLEAQRAAGTAVHSAGGPDDLFIILLLHHRVDAQILLTHGDTRTRRDQGAGATGHSRPTQKTPTSVFIKISHLNVFTKPMVS